MLFEFFKNIQSHYYQNEICAEFNTNHNLSLIGHVNSLEPSQCPLQLSHIDQNTFSFFHTNDNHGINIP